MFLVKGRRALKGWPRPADCCRPVASRPAEGRTAAGDRAGHADGHPRRGCGSAPFIVRQPGSRRHRQPGYSQPDIAVRRGARHMRAPASRPEHSSRPPPGRSRDAAGSMHRRRPEPACEVARRAVNLTVAEDVVGATARDHWFRCCALSRCVVTRSRHSVR